MTFSSLLQRRYFLLQEGSIRTGELINLKQNTKHSVSMCVASSLKPAGGQVTVSANQKQPRDGPVDTPLGVRLKRVMVSRITSHRFSVLEEQEGRHALDVVLLHELLQRGHEETLHTKHRSITLNMTSAPSG